MTVHVRSGVGAAQQAALRLQERGQQALKAVNYRHPSVTDDRACSVSSVLETLLPENAEDQRNEQ